MLSPTTSKLIMTTPSLLTKAIIALERFWNPGTVRKHLMRTIILALSRNNEVFFLTKIFNEILNNFYSILFNCIFNTLHFRIFHFQIISPVEDISSSNRKLVFFWKFLDTMILWPRYLLVKCTIRRFLRSNLSSSHVRCF